MTLFLCFFQVFRYFFFRKYWFFMGRDVNTYFINLSWKLIFTFKALELHGHHSITFHLYIYLCVMYHWFFKKKWLIEKCKTQKNSVYLICPFSFYNYRYEFTRYLYITFLYTQLRPILILFWGKICFLWNLFYKTAIVVQVYSRKKYIFRGYRYDFIEFNFM